jgi:hypothetical protein
MAVVHAHDGGGSAIGAGRHRGLTSSWAIAGRTVGVLVWLGLGLTFFADEWTIIADRAVTLGTCCAHSTSTRWRSRSSFTGRCRGRMGS